MSRENGRVADGGSGDGWGEGPGRGVSGITGGMLAGGCPEGGSLARRVPDLGLLEVLLAVDRLGSLGRAARELGITQPAASGRVRSLERQLGVGLVARSPRGSRLTPTGLLVAGWARRVTEAAEAFDAGARALRGRRDSRLRVAASMTIGEYLLPGWLVALRAVRPDTAVSLRAGSTRMVVEGLLDGEADLGFVEGLGVPAGTDGAVIARDRLLVLVRPGHPWTALTGGLDPALLATTPLILREEGSGTREVLDAALAPYDGPERPLLELSSTTALKSAALSGVGPAVLSELVVGEEVAAGTLVPVPVRGVGLGRVLRAVWRRGERPSGAARDLLSLTRGNG
ncbi:MULTISPECIES: LysR family transcriptional regulator [Streptomyces]|uniref:LysR family transcriptional regulator n=1 Tax=Streptomyces evansiae TaxID=3075535 RepID=A0ABU2QU61_9ACTN|nr:MULTISPECIES: LysR family transcriptional regulator [unclassified Streptomyces]MDT0407972.1 LysR family transcriptional regulator [Streptomyces sp. DSM 41979]MYQ59117.1 LysR family transcriptional regulator [Streptomyces sp. SID4926]SCE29224.1 transcriptional regulator [Streptomyces sp. DfronAA-171]